MIIRLFLYTNRSFFHCEVRWLVLCRSLLVHICVKYISGATSSFFSSAPARKQVWLGGVVVLWTNNCYRYSSSILYLLLFNINLSKSINRRTRPNQWSTFRKAWDWRSCLLTNVLTYKRSPLLTIDPLMITISTIDNFTYNWRSSLLTKAKAWDSIINCHTHQLNLVESKKWFGHHRSRPLCIL